jgi:hypothetical protein
MPTVRIPLDLSWGGGVSGAPGANVFHGRVIEGAISSDIEDLTSILEDYYTSIADLYTADLTISFAGEVTGVGDDAGDFWTAAPWTVTGTDGLDHLAPVLQMLVNWRTDSGGRQGRGRTYHGPLSTGVHQDNGTPTEAARTLLQDAADALIGASDGIGDGALGVYSRVGNTFRDFTSANVPNEFAILTSRRD